MSSMSLRIGADHTKLILSEYLPDCPGVVAFGQTLAACQRELVSVLRDWILVKRRRGAPIPVTNGIELNEAKNEQKMADL